MTNLVFGCGYLGSRVAALWLQNGERVAALTRSRGELLRSRGIEPVLGDVLDADLPLLQAETVLYAVAMDRTSGRTFRQIYIDGLENVLRRLPKPKRFIYVSSTSVYGQTDGSFVDEDSPTEPVEANGQIVLEAEQLLRSRNPDAIILRFAGIYGPGRVIRRSAIERGEALVGDGDKWLNLIHVDDGAAAIVTAAARGDSGGTYLIADDMPVRRRDFYAHMAELLAAPAPRFVPVTPGDLPPPHEGGNRRANSRKLRQELQVKLRYPDYRSGLRQALQEPAAQA